MAYIGLANPIIAKLNSDGTYSDAAFVGKAIGVDINPNYAEGTLKADNMTAEADFMFVDADITLNTSTLPMDVHATMFGSTHTAAVTTGTKSPESLKENINNIPNNVGFGCDVMETVDGGVKYLAIWVYKAKFKSPGTSYKTKGDNIEYQTPSISGKGYGDSNGDWKEITSHDSEAEALAWLKDKANMTE